MFNFSGSEIIFLLILGLVVLGPEKLPPVLRKMGQLYGQFKRVTGDAQSEFRGAFAEPIRDMQKAANEYKSVFTDASKEVEGEYLQTKSLFADSANLEQLEDAVEPQFIPY
jgi:sec-independent protein translocase protein TatB